MRLKKTGVIQRLELPAIITGKGITVDLSTVDYLGHFKGIPVAIDAKESKNSKINIKTNFKPHQIQFLNYFKNSCTEQKKCISGFLAYFYEIDKDNLYFIDIDFLLNEIESGKKSIDIKDIPVKLKFMEDMYDEYTTLYI